jgi:pSer/pThr/pTyr-binding forkhead associated (FHA) protein
MTVPLLMLLARVGLMICLYAFLLAVVYILWRDIQKSGGQASNIVAHPSRLIWRDALAEPAAPFLLACASHRIGRSPTVEVCLPDDTISLIHARLWFHDSRWWLEDLGSKNGTFLNEVQLAQKMVLSPGDLIRLGRCVLEFQTEG